MSEYEYVFPGKPDVERRSEKSSNLVNGILFLGLLSSVFIAFDLSLMFMGGLILVLIIHELGHFLAMKWFKYQNVQVKIVPLFGVAIQGEKKEYSQKERLIVALAGAVPSLLVASLAIQFVEVPLIYQSELSLLLLSAVFVNVVNLLPLDMFDGGRVVESLFFINNDNAKFIFSLISSLSIIILGIFLQNYIIAAFGFIIGLKVRSLHKLRDIRRSLFEEKVEYHSNFKNLSNRAYWLIREKVIKNSKTLSQVVPSLREVWENEPLLINQVEEILDRKVKSDLPILGKIVLGILWIVSISVPIYLILTSNLISLVDVI